MVAPWQIEVPFYRGIARQRARVFKAFAQIIAKTAILFLCTYVFAASRRVGADLLQFAAREIERLLVVETISKQLQRVWKDKLLKNNWVW